MKPVRALRALALAAALLAPAAAQEAAPVDMKAVLADAPAATLGAYRLFTDEAARTPNASVIPYALNTPLFSDYADKRRYVFLPAGERAAYRADGVMAFPVGAVLVKTFAYPVGGRERFIETRLLIHKKSGWVALPYVWNAAQTEARLAIAGATIPVTWTAAGGGAHATNYLVPNTNQCKECHSRNKTLVPLGPTAGNLNGAFPYAEGAENQLAHWVRLGLLDGAPAATAAPRWPRWDDPNDQTLDARARAYLHANCAHCHNPEGAASNSGLDLTWSESDPSHLGVLKRPVAAGRASGGLFYAIAPGDPEHSIMVYRMASLDPGVMMPELGRTMIHEEGLALVRDWIKQMKR